MSTTQEDFSELGDTSITKEQLQTVKFVLEYVRHNPDAIENAELSFVKNFLDSYKPFHSGSGGNGRTSPDGVLAKFRRLENLRLFGWFPFLRNKRKQEQQSAAASPEPEEFDIQLEYGDESSAQGTVEVEKAADIAIQAARAHWCFDYAGAIRKFNESLSINPAALTFTLRAECLLDMKRLDDALEDCNRAITVNAGYQRAYVVRGKIFMLMEEYFSALSDFQTALWYGDDPEIDALVQLIKPSVEAQRAALTTRQAIQHISHIPDELLVYILEHLPIRLSAEFRTVGLVCKQFYRLVKLTNRWQRFTGPQHIISITYCKYGNPSVGFAIVLGTDERVKKQTVRMFRGSVDVLFMKLVEIIKTERVRCTLKASNGLWYVVSEEVDDLPEQLIDIHPETLYPRDKLYGIWKAKKRVMHAIGAERKWVFIYGTDVTGHRSQLMQGRPYLDRVVEPMVRKDKYITLITMTHQFVWWAFGESNKKLLDLKQRVDKKFIHETDELKQDIKKCIESGRRITNILCNERSKQWCYVSECHLKGRIRQQLLFTRMFPFAKLRRMGIEVMEQEN